MSNLRNCPICNTELNAEPQQLSLMETVWYQCPHCGPFQLTHEAKSDRNFYFEKYEKNVTSLPYKIRRMQDGSDVGPIIRTEQLKSFLEFPEVLSPQQQADNLILELGQRTFDPGEEFEISFFFDGAKIGSPSSEAFRYVIHHMLKEDILLGEMYLGDQSSVQLSFSGWDRYEELRKGTGTGTTAFMAMQFGDSELDHTVNTCLRPAVTAAGFNLRRIDDLEHQRAGLIDDRLRVEINAARFMICDLTHNNNGAYWEAGYAEGLGKPIIYTCKKSVFDDRIKSGGGTHFDTNHHLHILWDSDKLTDANDRLKACIRATVPDAIQND